jgi:hypothetical protein
VTSVSPEPPTVIDMRSQTSAYPVPFWIDRESSPHLYRIVNVGDESVVGLRATLLGSGHLVPIRATTLQPGSSLSLTVIGHDLRRDTVVVLHWFRPDGDEYLWRFSF